MTGETAVVGSMSRRKRRFAVVLILAGGAIAMLLILHWLRKPVALYNLTAFTLPGGVRAFPRSINDRGQVAGLVFRRGTGGQESYVFLWDPDTGARDLVRSYSPLSFTPILINNRGQVAGSVIDPNQAERCFLWDSDHGQQRLATLSPRDNEVHSLNNRGQAVGFSRTPSGIRHAVLWNRDGSIVDLGTLGGISSVACSINDAGQVVGFSVSTDKQWHAFLWDPNAGMKDLGITNQAVFSPDGIHINNKGVVAGLFGSPSDNMLISVWSSTEGTRSLPAIKGLYAWPIAFNDVGQLLVRIDASRLALGDLVLHERTDEYLWDPDKGFVRLDHGAVRGRMSCFQTRDINNKGQIATVGDLGSKSASQGFILEPIAEGHRKTLP